MGTVYSAGMLCKSASGAPAPSWQQHLASVTVSVVVVQPVAVEAQSGAEEDAEDDDEEDSAAEDAEDDLAGDGTDTMRFDEEEDAFIGLDDPQLVCFHIAHVHTAASSSRGRT
jgi:hypothetical protein